MSWRQDWQPLFVSHDAGIMWMLSDQVVAMRPSLWAAQYERLAQSAVTVPAARAALPAAALREWLSHQKGLRSLGESALCLPESQGRQPVSAPAEGVCCEPYVIITD